MSLPYVKKTDEPSGDGDILEPYISFGNLAAENRNKKVYLKNPQNIPTF